MVGPGGPVTGRGAQAGGSGLQLGPQLGRRRLVVVFVVEVGLHQDVTHAHEAGDRGEGIGVRRSHLHRIVEGVEEILGRRRSLRHLLAADVPSVQDGRVDRVGGVAVVVVGEVGPGHAQDPAAGPLVVQGLRRGQGVAGELGGLRVLVGDGRTVEGGGIGGGHHGHRKGGEAQGERAGPLGDRGDAGAEQHGDAQREQRGGPVGRAQRQAGRGLRHERLQGVTQPGGISVRVDADGEHQSHRRDEDEEGPVPPAGEDGGDEGESGHREAERQGDELLGQLDRRRHPGPEAIGPVEVPVPQPPEHLNRSGGLADRLDGLGGLEDGDAVAALDGEPGDPPEGDHQGQPDQLQRRGAGLAPCRLAQADHRVDEPERRPEADVQQRGGVDAAHQGHDDGEPGAVPPPPLRTASAASATSHGSPAQGSSRTEIRPTYCRKYGENM